MSRRPRLDSSNHDLDFLDNDMQNDTHSNILIYDEDHGGPARRLKHSRSTKRNSTKSTRHTRAASVALSTNRTDTHVDNPRLLQSDDAAFGLLSPSSSQSLGEVHAARSLISPPPEETLRAGSGHSSLRARSFQTTSIPFPPANDDPSLVDLVADNSVAKRKRQAPSISSISNSMSSIRSPATLETTPNPKPRKQGRHILSTVSRASNVGHEPTTLTKSISPSKPRPILSSRSADNPDADYLPPMLSFNRERPVAKRRSATPITPYEPPAEQFTPPREVLYTPSPIKAAQTVSKSSKRKTMPRTTPMTKAKSHAKGKKLALTIKKEPPDIDLSLPLPPPSPTDDPLLLSGPPRRRKAKRSDISTYARDTPPMQSTSPVPIEVDEPQVQVVDVDADLPPSSPITEDDDDDRTPLPVFNLQEAVTADGWSDDGDNVDDGFDQHGEYTGRYKTVVVPTKADPPSSCTRERMDAWGHPKSPFPYAKSLDQSSSRSSETPTRQRGRDSIDVTDGVPDDGARGQEPVEAEVEDVTPMKLTVNGPDEDEDGPDVTRSLTPTQATLSVLTNDARGSPTPPPAPRQDRESSFNPFDISPKRTWLTSTRLSWSPMKVSNKPSENIRDADAPSVLRESSKIEEVPTQDAIINEVPRSNDEGLLHSGRIPPQVELHPSRSESTEGDRPSSSTVVASGDHVAGPAEDNDRRDAEDVDRELSAPLDPETDDDDDGGDRASYSHHTFNSARQNMMTSFGPQGVDLATDNYVSLRQGSPSTHETSLREEMVNVSHHDDDKSTRVGREHEDVISDDELDGLDEGVIKISSDDPRAAARAAAILKLHDYDCLPNTVLQRRRRFTQSPETLKINARRKLTLESGITKHSSPGIRRRTLGSIVGDKVFIPGSPLMILPELLKEAQVNLHRNSERVETPKHDRLGSEAIHDELLSQANFDVTNWQPAVSSGSRSWAKDDWRNLDACFTDERLILGARQGLDHEQLASVDDVQLQDVVNRFIEEFGPFDSYDDDWNRENLLARARALQRKQRSGKIAPPTPTGRRRSLASTPEVPDFTPLARRPKLSVGANDPPLPAPLLAPRYSHLMEEALVVSRNEAPAVDNRPSGSPPTVPFAANIPGNIAAQDPSKRSLASRMKGILFSYLPVPVRQANVKKDQVPHPALPIPPPEVFEKPRPPISTPAPKPLPKATHPKELVNLHPAPAKPSMIPRRTQVPRRMIDLRPVVSPSMSGTRISESRGHRRSSGGSVKELIENFENIHNTIATTTESSGHFPSPVLSRGSA